MDSQAGVDSCNRYLQACLDNTYFEAPTWHVLRWSPVWNENSMAVRYSGHRLFAMDLCTANYRTCIFQADIGSMNSVREAIFNGLANIEWDISHFTYRNSLLCIMLCRCQRLQQGSRSKIFWVNAFGIPDHKKAASNLVREQDWYTATIRIPYRFSEHVPTRRHHISARVTWADSHDRDHDFRDEMPTAWGLIEHIANICVSYCLSLLLMTAELAWKVFRSMLY